VPPFLVLDGLTKTFAGNPVLCGLSLEAEKGEVVALLGPSGSGKTTALRLIAGFETPDEGALRIDGEDVIPLPPERRRLGMVFQHYALFPHLTVGKNVAFGLEGSRLGREGIARRVAESLALVDLPGFAERRVGEISGGQQQRVALARALAPEPRVLLLDEPLSNLDPSLRERTRRELRRAIERVGITTVLVTHEQDEAFHLGDRVAVLHGGMLHQAGKPEDLYERPATRFVAGFVGRASGLAGTLEPDGAVLLPAQGGSVRWRGTLAPELEGVPAGTAVELVVRPEALELRGTGAPESLAGRVTERRYAGTATFYLVRLDQEGRGGGEVEVAAGPSSAGPGDLVGVVLGERGPAPRVFRA